MILTAISLLPWISMPFLSYFRVGQITEVLIMNGGFVLTSFLFFWRHLKESKDKNNRLLLLLAEEQQKEEIKPTAEDVFKQNCDQYNLTAREIEVAILMLEGKKYKEIGDTLFISERTVTKHSQNMFLKVGVTNKFDLTKALSS